MVPVVYSVCGLSSRFCRFLLLSSSVFPFPRSRNRDLWPPRRQDPPPNTRVSRGSTVTLTVWGYGGPRPVVQRVIVPDLRDRFLRQANSELRLRGLKNQRFRSNDFARTWDRDLALGGRVFWQDRAPGTLVRRGSIVRLRVYVLRTGRTTTVPDLRFADIYSALIGYHQAGLNVRTITYSTTQDLRLHGTVLSTRPPAGRVVPARSPIDVRIRIKRVSSDRSGVHGVPNLLNQDLSRALRGLFNAYHKLRFINVVNTRDYKRHGLVFSQSVSPGVRIHNRNQVGLNVDFKMLR